MSIIGRQIFSESNFFKGFFFRQLTAASSAEIDFKQTDESPVIFLSQRR